VSGLGGSSRGLRKALVVGHLFRVQNLAVVFQEQRVKAGRRDRERGDARRVQSPDDGVEVLRGDSEPGVDMSVDPLTVVVADALSFFESAGLAGGDCVDRGPGCRRSSARVPLVTVRPRRMMLTRSASASTSPMM